MNQPTNQTGSTGAANPPPYHVSVVALPDAAISTLYGIYDVLNAYRALATLMPNAAEPAPFQVEIVGEQPGALPLASGAPVQVQRSVDSIKHTDVIIVPSIFLSPAGWQRGRYPKLVDWFTAMHARGALLCSACSGIFLLAETGLFDHKDVSVHFGFAKAFAAAYPNIPAHPERALVIAGLHEELITSGASASWHDLTLYLYARFAGSTSAQQIARMFALQWHQEGLSPYIVFEGKTDHGDVLIQTAQQWLSSHFTLANPVEEMVKRSELAERTFKRRFTAATGLAPIAYVQRLRIEDAKRRLERTDTPVDEISWCVGYEDAAFFRRLFKRITGMAPSDYRRKFRLPTFADLR